MVVLDTCAIIEVCKDTPKFSAKAIKKMMAGAYVLSISFAEIACKMKIGKLEMSLSPRDLYAEYSQIKSVKIINIGIDEWLDSIELDWRDNRDPADRIITAFSMKKRIPVVTNDKKIAAFYQNVLW